MKHTILRMDYLADTVKKLITRVPQIKKVAQPYNSFGGLVKETDLEFYRRVSERLRHKNRSITLWDYEHLILQEFPDIYKVKCLNHTSKNSFLSAGNVTIVVVPDTVNRNVFDIYKPRVSNARIATVKEYITQLNSDLVEVEVINPEYEEVVVSLEVKFHKEYDENFYLKQLELEIKKLLSPWAFDESKDVSFGRTLHKSIVVNYLENIEYVDYVQYVKIEKEGEESTTNIGPSSPKSILSSSKSHNIKIAKSLCNTENEK